MDIIWRIAAIVFLAGSVTTIFADINTTSIYCGEERLAKYYGSVKVIPIEVHDGDTIKVNISGYPSIVGKAVLVRIARIDAPEITSKNHLVRSLAQRIQQYVEMRINRGKVIWLSAMQRDKYFRILAEVWIDGYNIADRLLELGFALPYDGGTKRSWDELMTESLAQSLNLKLDRVMKADLLLPKLNTIKQDALFSADSDYV